MIISDLFINVSQIFIELNQQGRGDGTPDPYTPGLQVLNTIYLSSYTTFIFIIYIQSSVHNLFFPFQSWMNATAVRFRFSGLYRKFDMMAIKWVSENKFSFSDCKIGFYTFFSWLARSSVFIKTELLQLVVGS